MQEDHLQFHLHDPANNVPGLVNKSPHYLLLINDNHSTKYQHTPTLESCKYSITALMVSFSPLITFEKYCHPKCLLQITTWIPLFYHFSIYNSDGFHQIFSIILAYKLTLCIAKCLLAMSLIREICYLF